MRRKVTKVTEPLPIRQFVTGLIVAVIIASLIRLPYFSQIPAGLNRDEAALGYNAYSLLKTGHDEYGKKWPISITSFGDQKLPGYVYGLIPIIAVFDLSSWSVRLLSLVAGYVVVVASGVLTYQVTGRFWPDRRWQLVSTWLAMIFIAISPWGNHFARVAYEAHVAMALLLSGLCVYHLALTSKQVLRQRWLLLLSALLLIATLFTYHSYHVFTPLVLLILLVIDRKKVLSTDKAGVVGSLIIGLIGVVILYSGGVWQANIQKNQGISPFHKNDLFNHATELRQQLPGDSTFYKKILVNRPTEALARFGQNLVSVPAGTFLFVTGSVQGDHNPGATPNLHLFIAPLLIAGVLKLYGHRSHRASGLLLAILIAALVAPALTINPQHTVRFSPAFPFLEIVAAIGTVALYVHLTQKWQRLVMVGIVIAVAVSSTGRHMLRYWYIVPTNTEDHQHSHVLAQAIDRYTSQGMNVLTQSPSSSPYIWYVFEKKYDPTEFLKNVEYYPTDKEGFKHVKRLGTVRFEKIVWDELYEQTLTQELVLILKPPEIPDDKDLKVLEILTDSRGIEQYQVLLLTKEDAAKFYRGRQSEN